MNQLKDSSVSFLISQVRLEADIATSKLLLSGWESNLADFRQEDYLIKMGDTWVPHDTAVALFEQLVRHQQDAIKMLESFRVTEKTNDL